MPDERLKLLTEEQFKFLVDHECKRAQRYQHFFSLLVIMLENLDSQSPIFTKILNLIKNLIRDVDPMGVIQGNRVVILLFYADDPSSIARRIENKIQSEIPQLNSKIGEACFPSNATTSEDLIRISLDQIS